MATGNWRKAPDDLVERFAAAVAGIEGLERRKMFGYTAGFIGGNMVTGLHQESWIVRRSVARDDERRGRRRAVARPRRAPVRGESRGLRKGDATAERVTRA